MNQSKYALVIAALGLFAGKCPGQENAEGNAKGAASQASAPADATADRISIPQMPIKTTLCEVSAAPEHYRGKVVEIRAVVQTGYQTSLLRDDSCSTFIWIEGIDVVGESPDNQAASADAVTALKKDRQFQKMLDYLDKKYKPKGGAVCSRCPLYKVTATVVGRFEYVGKMGTDAQEGFGYMKSYDSRLILLGVSNPVAETIDRSAGEKAK